MNSLGKDSTILEKEWGEKYEKHIFLKTDFLCVEPICRDHLSRLYSVQRTLYRKQLPCSFSIFVALVFDAAYISYKNVKCNKVLNHFSLLLLLLGWQFLLYLFDFRPISKAVSMLLLPVCFYQSAYFIQTFLFQSSAYRGQKALLAF